jgi:pyrroloquinoline quinone biosynthesis protein D
MNRQKTPTLRQGFRLQWEPRQDCHVLLYPEGMIKLNASAGKVLDLVNGQRSVAAIIDLLSACFSGEPDIDQDVMAFLEVAHAQFWIE